MEMMQLLDFNKNLIMKAKITFFTILLLTISSCSKSPVSTGGDDDNNPPQENWYKTSTLNSGTHIIEEPKSSQANVSYLIKGTTKAIMFDTGSGENKGINGVKIKYLINKLTDLPITLLLSHFHFDHNQNISEFDKIAFPDLSFLRQKVVNGIYTFSSEELFSGSYPASTKVTEWLPVNTDIDLGNRIIQLVNIPGHTKESIAIIDKTNKMAFLGDYLYNGPLFLFDKNDINTYKQTVDYLILNLDSEYKLFGAHGFPEVSYSKLKNLQDFISCIQNDICKPVSEFVWGYNTLLYENKGMKIRIFL